MPALLFREIFAVHKPGLTAFGHLHRVPDQKTIYFDVCLVREFETQAARLRSWTKVLTGGTRTASQIVIIWSSNKCTLYFDLLTVISIFRRVNFV